MKKIVFLSSVFGLISLMSLVVFPKFSLAHGEAEDLSGIKTGSQMMQYIEDQALGEKTHEEMEYLMEKMMKGDMTDEETKRMTKLMNEHPGPYSMMMGRMMGMGRSGDIGGSPWGMMSRGGMMGGGMGGTSFFWPGPWLTWFGFLNYFLWFALLILSIIFLIQKITKPSKPYKS